MGIQGLLPLLKSIQQPIYISELAGSTVGVDVYCWLHKGAYGCAFELAQGNDSDVYINYVMKRVNLMLYYKVKPILVFDGGYLPSKSEKEAERRQKRKENKSQGLAHLKNGKKSLANECFQRSIDITPEMALNVMKACRGKGIDCIVAPYEADAQLAYLMKKGITQCTISEDSDLLVYGCEKVIFKMDANGQGQMIDLRQLPKLESLRMDGFTEQKFRQMCILSGCDYLQSVKGMGLVTAHKMLRTHSTVKKLIGSLRLNTKMSVPRDYETRFEKAEQTFLYQIVFDPNTNKLVPLNPLPDDLDPVHLLFAGHNLKWKQEHALDLAIGNLNPLTGIRIGDFKLTKALSLDNPSIEKEKKSGKTTICPQVKKSNSLLSSNKTYEAEKNLNGAFRETKSSEKANSQFVTPVRSKRSREKLDTDEEKESSKLARLYLTSTDEMTVDMNFEITESTSESVPQAQTLGVQQKVTKKQRHNPFRNPVIRKPQNESVVSRYFGLAGMEVTNNETSSTLTDSMAKTDLEGSFNSEPKEDNRNGKQVTDSQVSTIFNDESDEQDNLDLQESGYLSSSQPVECSPSDNCTEPVLPNSSPPFLYSSLPLSSNIHTNTPPLPNFPSTPKIPKNKKQKSLGMKSLSKQMSLDMFAYVKGRTTTEGSKTETNNVSPKRAVLADRSPPNCTLFKFTGSQEDEIEDENKKENCRIVVKNGCIEEENMPRLASLQRREEFMAAPPPRTIGVRTKPTTGLGRCRSVGLSRRRKTNKDTSKETNITTETLLNHFAYRGRERTSQGITS